MTRADGARPRRDFEAAGTRRKAIDQCRRAIERAVEEAGGFSGRVRARQHSLSAALDWLAVAADVR